MNGRWVHVLCAVWASEIRFGDEQRMRQVSGIEAIPESSYKYKCCLCHKTGSYVIKVGLERLERLERYEEWKKGYKTDV